MPVAWTTTRTMDDLGKNNTVQEGSRRHYDMRDALLGPPVKSFLIYIFKTVLCSEISMTCSSFPNCLQDKCFDLLQMPAMTISPET